MRKTAVAALAVLIFTGCASTPEKPAAPAANASDTSAPALPRYATAEEACRDTHVQCLDQPIAILLHVPGGKTYAQTMQAPIPVVQFDHLYIFPGMTLYIEAEVKNDLLVNLRSVPANVHPEKTLVITFEQGEMGTGEFGMALHIQQPFDRPLKYHAGIMGLETDGHLKQTSSCPVLAKGGAYETWPGPIFQIVLGEFHFLDPQSPDVGLCIF